MILKLSQCILVFLLFLSFVVLGYGATSIQGPIKIYEIPFAPQCFYFSPFNDGKIWVSNNGITQEFDPASGKITDLTTLLGDFAAGIMCDAVYDDPYDPNLFFIGNLSKGLLVYDKARDTARKYRTSTYFNDADIILIRPEKESIWIGTSNGLYRLNRADWKVAWIEKTKGMSVTKIASSMQDEIYFFNQGFWGGKFTGTVAKIWYRYQARIDELQKIPPPTFPDQEKITDLMPDRHNVQDPNDINKVWFIGGDGLGRKEKKSGQLTYFDLGCHIESLTAHDLCLTLLVDKSNIWLCFGHNLITVDKASAETLIIDEATIKARKQKLFDMEENLRNEENSIIFFQKVVNLIELYDTYFKVINNGQERVYYEIIDHIQGKAKKDIIPLLEDYLQSPETNPATIPYSLFGLLCAHCQAAAPEQALRCYEMLKQQYPNSRIFRSIDSVFAGDIQVLKKSVNDLKTIQASDLAPDQKLWETGQVYLALMRVKWNARYMGPDLTYPHSFLAEILKQYPDSTYADNAWWELHLNNWYWDDGMGMKYLNFALPKYTEFLSRYPTSELAPRTKLFVALDILSAIEESEAGHTSEEDIITPDQRREYLETARRMCSEAIQAGLDDRAVKTIMDESEGTETDIIYEPPTETLAKIEKYLQK